MSLPNTPFDGFFLTYGPKIYQKALLLRELLFRELPGVEEMVDQPAKIVGYGYGPRYKDMICTLIPSKKGLKLGFYKGSELEDPEKLLTGSGKVHKHVPIDVEAPELDGRLKALLEGAFKAYRERQ